MSVVFVRLVSDLESGARDATGPAATAADVVQAADAQKVSPPRFFRPPTPARPRVGLTDWSFTLDI